MTSIPPEYDKTVRIRGSFTNWWEPLLTKRFITILVALLFGGGSLAAWDVATKDDVRKSIAESEAKQRDVAEQRYEVINGVVKSQGGDIANINVKVEDIQTVQRRQIARQEARRLTAAIKDRSEREQEYDRLRDLNLRRLTTGRDPCGSLECDN